MIFCGCRPPTWSTYSLDLSIHDFLFLSCWTVFPSRCCFHRAFYQDLWFCFKLAWPYLAICRYRYEVCWFHCWAWMWLASSLLFCVRSCDNGWPWCVVRVSNFREFGYRHFLIVEDYSNAIFPGWAYGFYCSNPLFITNFLYSRSASFQACLASFCNRQSNLNNFLLSHSIFRSLCSLSHCGDQLLWIGFRNCGMCQPIFPYSLVGIEVLHYF